MRLLFLFLFDSYFSKPDAQSHSKFSRRQVANSKRLPGGVIAVGNDVANGGALALVEGIIVTLALILFSIVVIVTITFSMALCGGILYFRLSAGSGAAMTIQQSPRHPTNSKPRWRSGRTSHPSGRGTVFESLLRIYSYLFS